MKQTYLLTLERRISAERFAPYLVASAGDHNGALRLYERNLALSAAFWEVLSDVEILIRNAMHDELTVWSLTRYGDAAWYLDHGKVLDGEAIAAIDTARRHAIASGKDESPGRVVAELPLSFWRFLLAGRYERSLWFPCIHLLRNRIAHHEPIHNRPLAKLHDQALTTAEWVCPVSRQWIAARSRVPELLGAPLETSRGR
jgi:hypothetical protein